MNRALLVLVLLLLLVPRSPAIAPEPADLIFTNGNIYTVNAAQPHAEAVAIKAEHIVFVGTNEAAKKFSGPATKTIDLRGRTVVPGLTDSHYHIFGVGERLITLNLANATSHDAFLNEVKQEVANSVPGRWITGRGWIETF